MDKCLHARFQALGHPTRLDVVERLLRAPATVSELAAAYSMALPPFTKHLAALERAGLIRSVKQGRVRTCRIEAAALADMDRWFADRRSMWDARLDALGAYLNERNGR